MYRSKERVTEGNRAYLEGKLIEYLGTNAHAYFKGQKRRVSLAKLPNVITNRREGLRDRLRCFRVGVDILANAKTYSTKTIKGRACYEIRGLAAHGETVVIHLREEIDGKKNKRVYLISTYID